MNKHKKTWVLVTNKAIANFFVWDREHKQLHEITSLKDEDARKPERELRADRLGHGQGFNSKVTYTKAEHSDYKEQASHAFLTKVANFLNTEETNSTFDDLIIISPSDVYKTLQKNFSEGTTNKIKGHHSKNLANMPTPDLSKYYSKHLL